MSKGKKARRAFAGAAAVLLGLAGGAAAVAASGMAAGGKERRPLAVRLADAVLSRWPDPLAIAPDKGWEYTTGIVLRGVVEVYRQSRDPRYLDYIRRWVDAYVLEDGSIDFGEDAAGHNLDRIQPGVLLLLLHQETGHPKYAKAARWLRTRFDKFPRNRAGGFWHKQKYPNQMWLVRQRDVRLRVKAWRGPGPPRQRLRRRREKGLGRAPIAGFRGCRWSARRRGCRGGDGGSARPRRLPRPEAPCELYAWTLRPAPSREPDGRDPEAVASQCPPLV